MRVSARENGAAAAWAYIHEETQVAAVWTEKKEGRGEDAPPTAVLHTSGRGILAVYDGAGGSGARPVGRTPQNLEVTGAFLASRITHFAVEDWFTATKGHRSLTDGAGLHDAILDGLRRTGIPPGSKVSGTMVRHLPTTLAAIEYSLNGLGVDLVARWAGDSRAYVLDPFDGLQAVTRDDTEEHDALVLLTNDQPMNNLVCADRHFHINEHRLTVDCPITLICATDGFFNYVQSPAHFEHVLLDTMHQAENLQAWAVMLAESVQRYSADDASLVIVSFGYPTFDATRIAYSERREFLNRKYIQPLHGIRQGDNAQLSAVRKSCWEEYRSGYEKWLRDMEAMR
jgi:serine/threonine protein phosphatase PrpC